MWKRWKAGDRVVAVVIYFVTEVTVAEGMG